MRLLGSEVALFEWVVLQIVEFLFRALAIALNQLRRACITGRSGAFPGTPVASLIFSLRAIDMGGVLKFRMQIPNIFPTLGAHRAKRINIHFFIPGVCGEDPRTMLSGIAAKHAQKRAYINFIRSGATS